VLQLFALLIYAILFLGNGSTLATALTKSTGQESTQIAGIYPSCFELLGYPTNRLLSFASGDHTYDLFDRRIKKETFNTDGILIASTNYNYNGEMIWSSTSAQGSGGLTQTTYYLTGDHIDQWLARSVNGTTEWFLTDRMGTPQAIIKNTGAIVEKYDYGTFGDPLVGSGLSLPQIGFTGREFDSETGLMYYRARYYDPVIGRFLSEDPIGFAGGDSNLSRYVLNSPYGYRDPSGKTSDEEMEKRVKQQRSEYMSLVQFAKTNTQQAGRILTEGAARAMGKRAVKVGGKLSQSEYLGLMRNYDAAAKKAAEAITNPYLRGNMDIQLNTSLNRMEEIMKIIIESTFL